MPMGFTAKRKISLFRHPKFGGLALDLNACRTNFHQPFLIGGKNV